MGRMDSGHLARTAGAAGLALLVWLLGGGVVATEPGSAAEKDWAVEKDWADGMDVGKAALKSLDFTKARDAYSKAHEASRSFPEDDPRRRATLNKLAAAFNGLGAYDKSEPLLREALTLWEKTAQPGDLELATTLHNLAGVFYAKGDYGKAQPYLKWALAIREKLLPAEHPAIKHTKRSIETLGKVAAADPGASQTKETKRAEAAPKPKAAQPDAATPAPAKQEAASAPATPTPKSLQSDAPAPAKQQAAKAETPSPQEPKAPAPEPRAAETAPPKVAAKPPATQAAKAVEGGFLIHLASYKSPDKAAAGWDGLRRAFPDQLGKRTPVFRQVDLADQGTFHRLLAGDFASRDAAESLCDQLKAKKQYCLVVRK